MKSELNKLVEIYWDNPSEENFEQVYNYLKKDWEGKFNVLANHLGVDELEVRAMYDDVLLKCLKKCTGNFEHFLNRSLRNGRIDLGRHQTVVKKHESSIENYKVIDEESDAATLDYLILKQTTIEETGFCRLEEENQRQLIDYFKDKLKDPLTTAIVKEVLSDESSGKLRPTAIGRKLNVHPTIVTRKLAQLKKYYDSAIFGDYRDYLCG